MQLLSDLWNCWDMLGVQATVWDRLSPDFGGVLKRRCLREVVHGACRMPVCGAQM